MTAALDYLVEDELVDPVVVGGVEGKDPRRPLALSDAKIELPSIVSSVRAESGLTVYEQWAAPTARTLTDDQQRLVNRVLSEIDSQSICSRIDTYCSFAATILQKMIALETAEIPVQSAKSIVDEIEWNLARIKMDKHGVLEYIRELLKKNMQTIDSKVNPNSSFLRGLVAQVMERSDVMVSLANFQIVLGQVESKWREFQKIKDRIEISEREIDAPIELRTNIVRLSLALLGSGSKEEIAPGLAGKFLQIRRMGTLRHEDFQAWQNKTFEKAFAAKIKKGLAILEAKNAELAAAIEGISSEEKEKQLAVVANRTAFAESISIPPVKSYLDICVPDEENPLMRVVFNPVFPSGAEKRSTPASIFGVMEFPGMELTPICFEIRFDDSQNPEVRILSQTFPLNHEINSVDENYGRFMEFIRIIFSHIQKRSGENARLTFAHETMRRAYEKEPEPEAPDVIKTVGDQVKPKIYSLGEIRVMSEEIDKKMTDSRFWEDIVVRVNQARSFSVPFDIQTAFKPRPESPGITVRTAGNLDGTFGEENRFEGVVFIQGLTKDQEFLQIRGDLSTKTLRVECDSSPRFDGEGNVTRLRSVWLRAIAAMKSAFEENGWTVGFKPLIISELSESDPCSEALYLAGSLLFDEKKSRALSQEFTFEDPLTMLIELIQRKLRGIKDENKHVMILTEDNARAARVSFGDSNPINQNRIKKAVPARVFVRTPYSDPEARQRAQLKNGDEGAPLDGFLVE
ncbi:MAG: hypothetical protein WCW30_02310 [Candidatus Gracilibacteria bacterium]